MSDIDRNLDDHNVNVPPGASNGPVRPAVATHAGASGNISRKKIVEREKAEFGA